MVLDVLPSFFLGNLKGTVRRAGLTSFESQEHSSLAQANFLLAPCLGGMKTLSSYSHVKRRKQTKRGRAQMACMTALQAVGLCLEHLHFLCRSKSCDQISTEDAKEIELTAEPGQMMILDKGTWRSSKACKLKLQPPEADLAVQLLQKQRVFFGDLRYNIYHVCMQGPAGVEYDLLGDLAPNSRLKSWVHGRVWTELKVCSAEVFTNTFEIEQKKLEAALPAVQRSDSSIGAVLLLAARVQKEGYRKYAVPDLKAQLLQSGSWTDISPGGTKAIKGKLLATSKRPLVQVFAEMQWHDNPEGGRQKVGKLFQFLKAVGLQNGNAGKTAEKVNLQLAEKGWPVDLRLKELDLGLPGPCPWGGTRKVYRIIYDYNLL